jgi:general secretion pathway protein N
MAVIRLTRPLGTLFATFCALTATAAADPIDESARPPPEVEGVSAAEGTGVAAAARLSEAPQAPDANAKSRAGNPLWTVPLSALSSTRDRPLFSSSRRPPIVAVPMAAPPPKQEAVAPPLPERPLLALIGTIVSPTASLALLQGSDADAISRLRIGQENDGWQVRGISLRSIVVEKGSQSVKLDMPRPSETPAESPLPNIPAAGGEASPPRQR